MLDILQQKLLSWTPDKADQFFNNMPRFGPASGRIWETAPTGYFLYDSTYSAYFDYNGQSYILTVGDVSAEYTNKQVLSDAAVENNSVAIERPNLIQTVTIYSLPYTYIEQTRPYSGLGIGILNLQMQNENDPKKLFDELFTAYSDIGQQLSTLSTLTNQIDYSDFMDPYQHMYYDPGTQKYFIVGDFCVLPLNDEDRNEWKQRSQTERNKYIAKIQASFQS